MTSTTSYNNDKVVTGEVEYPASDPASGAFFQPDFKKNDDLKLMLDGSKDSLKLEAMKRIIGMIAKGRDASDLFPAVVKNVVSKNIEVKKLVYVYLVRYAEEQQDLALLSISTFQRALKDPNQLIRASALRVLSSIRVPMIVPIVMLAIRDSAADMSPYVRKTAAHAIPKLYSLDPEQKEELVAIIDKLLSDKAPLVVGSAAMAFSEVCGDRMSLIHRSYRKLCGLLADVDEWGQLAILNVLTVYAKTFFPDPNSEEYSSDSESEKPFYESDSDEDSPRKHSRSPTVDPDLRLLLRAAKPLLQSRNSGVVMAVAQLFYHCAPAQELPPVAKAMIRLLRAPVEVQSVVLNCIAALTVSRRALFDPYLKSFLIRNSDPSHIKLLKLEILTNLATESSAAGVIRELQAHAGGGERGVRAATLHALGRLALAVRPHTDACLASLLHLLSSKDEWVVCEAVVVVKRVVGGGAASAKAAVARAAKLLRSDRLAANARAAAVWLVAEHGAHHPRAAAVLAHMAASFADQEELVKLQVLSLAAKLWVTQADTAPVCRYVVALARYDASYDVRDRARMLRRLLLPAPSARLPAHAALIFCPDKPKPTIESSFKERQQYTVGTLSQYLGSAATGYRPLPTAPAATSGAELRDQHDRAPHDQADTKQLQQKNKEFYSEPESSGSGSSSGSSSSSSSGSESSGSEHSSEEDESSNEEKPSNQEKKSVKKTKEINDYESSSPGTSDSEPDSDASSSDGEESSEEKETEIKEKPSEQKRKEQSNLELLLQLDEVASTLPTMTPTCGGLLSPPAATTAPGLADDSITPVGPSLVPPISTELVSRVLSGGLSASRRWTRAPHLYSNNMCTLEISFTNCAGVEVQNIHISKKFLSGSRSVHEFSPIPSLGPGASATVTLGIDFADSIQPVELAVSSSLGEVTVTIKPPVGELMRAVSMSESRWDAEFDKLRGLTECEREGAPLEDDALVCRRVFETANLAAVGAPGDPLRFAGRLLSSQELVLVAVRRGRGGGARRVCARCPNMAAASILANDIAQAFHKLHAV